MTTKPSATQERAEPSGEARFIDRITGRPVGDHGTAMAAIRFALDCEDDLANRDAFLRAWREGNLSEWPEYYSWLENVEPIAALSEQPRTDAAAVEVLPRHFEQAIELLGEDNENASELAGICARAEAHTVGLRDAWDQMLQNIENGTEEPSP